MKNDAVYLQVTFQVVDHKENRRQRQWTAYAQWSAWSLLGANRYGKQSKALERPVSIASYNLLLSMFLLHFLIKDSHVLMHSDASDLSRTQLDDSKMRD